jgi:tetratricopeptide (TPR) repeat protein
MTGVRSESTAYHDLGRMSNAAWHHGQKLESEAINPADDTRLRAQDRYTEALILARQAREQAPPLYPIPYRLEAQALSALGRGRAALAAWQRSAELLPADGSVHQNLGTTLLYDLNDPAASIGAYTRAVELGSLESRAFLALARLRLGQINQAKEALEPFREVLNALASNPLTPSARRPALPIPTRAVVAASLLARREGHLERANALASYLGPKGSALLEEEWSRLTTPSGNRDTQKLP